MRRVSGEGKATLADALVRMADATRAAEPGESAETRTTGADRAAVVVHLAPDALDEGHQATLDDGTRVSAERFRRVACDCALLAVQKGARGAVLDVGRKTRHVEHWMNGGEPKLPNVVALCAHHHRLLGFRGSAARAGEGVRGAPSRARHVIDEDTALTFWDGRPADIGACVWRRRGAVGRLTEPEGKRENPRGP